MNQFFYENEILNRLADELPSVWDGKAAVLYMKNNGCRNWRQMEWPGFYFQFMCERILGRNGFMKIPGPRYGNVVFDGAGEIPYDFKTHSFGLFKRDSGNIPTNGYLETAQAIRDYGKVGFIIANGETEYDDDGNFKLWHDALKGGISDYELARVARHASSRKRKTVFKLKEIIFYYVDAETLQYCGSFQKNFRNANGSRRNPKVMINLDDGLFEKKIFTI